MGKSIKGTRTEKNLGISFAGESQARMRYTYFASTAKKKATNRLLLFLQKQPIRKKNMLSVCSSGWKVAW